MNMVGGSSLTAWFALCFWRRRFLIIVCMLLVILLVTIYNTKCALTDCEDGLTLRPQTDLYKRALRGRSSVKFFANSLLAETQLTAKGQQNITQENVSDGKQLPKQVKAELSKKCSVFPIDYNKNLTIRTLDIRAINLLFSDIQPRPRSEQTSFRLTHGINKPRYYQPLLSSINTLKDSPLLV